MDSTTRSDKENGAEKLSVVFLRGKNAKYPKKCACCGKQIGKSENNGYSVCDECAGFKKSVFLQAAVIIAVSVLLGLCGFVAAAFLYAFSYIKASGVAVITAATAFFVFAILKKAPFCFTSALTEKPVKTERYGEKTIYIFQNSAYAEEFRTINAKNLIESDTFERRYIKKKKAGKAVSSLFSALKHPFSYPLIAVAICAVILTAAYRPLSDIWNGFGSYMTNRCIYPECSLNKGDNLYYCNEHKCSADGCERPIEVGSKYCYEHSAE